MSKISSIYLSREEYARMMKVCEKEGCTPYALTKRILLDHISAYPLEDPTPTLEPEISEAGETNKAETSEKPEPAIRADEVAERVKKILHGGPT